MDKNSIYFFKGQFKAPRMINLFCLNMAQPLNNDFINMISLVAENSDHIYMTTSALYLTVTRNQPRTSVDSTYIQKIQISGKEMRPSTHASAIGTIQDEFSMYQTNNTFRIITTALNPAPGLKGVIITTFDSDLNQIAEESFDIGRRVMFSRFIENRLYFSAGEYGNKFYMVEFVRNTPYLRSSFSTGKNITYIHPYNDNFVIGVSKQLQGKRMVISLIDVSYSKDVFLSSEVIYDVESFNYRVDFDDKGFFASEYFNKIGLPVRVTKYLDSETVDGVSAAFIYEIKNNEIWYVGSVRHFATSYDHVRDSGVEKIFYIGDRLYTKSACQIKINDIETLGRMKQINIPCDQNSFDRYVMNPNTF